MQARVSLGELLAIILSETWKGRHAPGWSTHLLNMSVTRSISCSAAAIFSADDGCGLPSPNIDMIIDCELGFVKVCGCVF